MTDLLGPANAPNATSVRPGDGRVFPVADTFFKSCTSQQAGDGTQLQDVWLNGMLQQVRRAIRGMGITENNASDDMLLNAIQAAALLAVPNADTPRNLLMNGAFNVNQRVFAGGALGQDVYGFDRWRGGAGGCTVSLAAGIVTLTGPLKQAIASPNLGGVQVAVSLDNPSANITVSVGDNGANTVSGTINAGAGRKGVLLTVPVAASGNVTVQLSTGGATTFANVMLERASTIRQYENRPFFFEYAHCLRYYQKGWKYAVVPGYVVAGQTPFSGVDHTDGWSYRHEVVSKGVNILSSITVRHFPMRTAPTLTLYDAAGAAGKISLFTSVAGAHIDGNLPYDKKIGETAFTVWTYTDSGTYGTLFNHTLDAEIYI